MSIKRDGLMALLSAIGLIFVICMVSAGMTALLNLAINITLDSNKWHCKEWDKTDVCDVYERTSL